MAHYDKLMTALFARIAVDEALPRPQQVLIKIPEHPIETEAGEVGRMYMQNQRSQKNESWFPYRPRGSFKNAYREEAGCLTHCTYPYEARLRWRNRSALLLVCVSLASHAYVSAATGLRLQSLREGQRRERTRKGGEEEKRTLSLAIVVRGART